jgi:hypothetical protein
MLYQIVPANFDDLNLHPDRRPVATGANEIRMRVRRITTPKES